MAITHASQDTSETTSYITAEDCKMLLSGWGADDDGGFFQAFWEKGIIKRKLDFLLAMAKEEVDRKAKVRFETHTDVDVVFSGDGKSYIDASDCGFVPLDDVSYLALNGSETDVDGYVWDTNGKIQLLGILARADSVSAGLFGAGFPVGSQNIEATISWGYASIPYKIRAAAAYEVGAQLLIQSAEVDDLRYPATPDGATVQYGDMRVVRQSRTVLASKLQKESTRLCRGWKDPLVYAPSPNSENDSTALYQSIAYGRTP
jgi:hypothetical protein